MGHFRKKTLCLATRLLRLAVDSLQSSSVSSISIVSRHGQWPCCEMTCYTSSGMFNSTHFTPMLLSNKLCCIMLAIFLLFLCTKYFQC